MSTIEKARIGAKIALIGGNVLWERARRPRPTTLATVPPSTEALTPEWLTAALFGRHPGARVNSVNLGNRSDGSTSRQVLLLEYNDEGRATGLPERIFCKSSPKFTSRLITGLSGALESEAGFYQTLRPEVEMESPLAYYTAVDPASARSIFLLEDIAFTRAARFGDPTNIYVGRQQAESMMQNIAAYHGRFWESPILRRLPWLQTSLGFQQRVNAAIDFEKRTLVGIDRSEAVAPPDFLRRRREIWPATMRSLAMNVRGPRTLLHSDMHLGNWYAVGEHGMGLYDWQCMTTGEWALDVVYAVMSALTIEDRRAWERELLELYLEELARAGGIAPPFDEAWLRYRQQVFHGLVFWLYTIGSGRMQPQMQKQSVAKANVARMTQATIDLESLDSVA
jgi:hypothetical protein